MALERLVPSDLPFTHLEGNSDAHAKASLMGSSVTCRSRAAASQLGTWQGIYFAEFDGPRAPAPARAACWRLADPASRRRRAPAPARRLRLAAQRALEVVLERVRVSSRPPPFLSSSRSAE